MTWKNGAMKKKRTTAPGCRLPFFLVVGHKDSKLTISIRKPLIAKTYMI
jgi:hypothetical protein